MTEVFVHGRSSGGAWQMRAILNPQAVTIVAIVILLCLCLCNNAMAHTGDRVFVAPELPTQDIPLIDDGSLEDWESAVGFAAVTSQDLRIVTGQDGPVIRLEDLAVRLFLGWNYRLQEVYLAIEILDDQIDDFDFVHVMIDADHSGGPYWALESDPANLELSSNAQIYYFLTHPDAQYGLYQDHPLISWTTRSPWTDFKMTTVGDLPARTIIEMKITPWDNLGPNPGEGVRSELEPGAFIGFQLAIGDADAGLYVLSDVNNSQSGYTRYADRFVDVELLPCHRADCSRVGTAVVNDSWARIKAGLR